MELRHLRYFLAVAEEGHFGRAAEKLHIVQPALSMQIRALEDELGGQLFLRTSRRVELTEAGAVLKVEAMRTIEQAERARVTTQKMMRGEVGRVRLGFAGNAIFTASLPEALRHFSQTNPAVELDLRQMAPQVQAQAIIEGRLDVGYAPTYGQPFDPALLAELVGEWPWMVAMMRDHRLASRDSLSGPLLADEPFILYGGPDSDRAQMAELRGLLGCEPKVAYRIPDTLSVLALAGVGLGIALVPASLSSVPAPNVVYRTIEALECGSKLVMISRANETAGSVLRFLETARRNVRHALDSKRTYASSRVFD